MRVALTGSPGVGKTTLAQAARKRGIRIVDVKAWAREEKCVVAFDEEDDAEVIDIVELASLVPDDDGATAIYDGHVSHLLDVDVIWVLRADPQIIKERLLKRGYKKAKIIENMEAEAMDLILQEAMDAGIPVVQRVAGERSPDALLDAFLNAGMREDVEAIDWSDQLPVEATWS